jgi:NAD+ synthase (glutamine-hydrolysing)
MEVARERVAESGLPLIYVNLTGGQDELVFDGASFALDANGSLCAQFPTFEAGLYLVELDNLQPSGEITPPPESDALVYQALVLGVRDYINKNGFPGVLVGVFRRN